MAVAEPEHWYPTRERPRRVHSCDGAHLSSGSQREAEPVTVSQAEEARYLDQLNRRLDHLEERLARSRAEGRPRGYDAKEANAIRWVFSELKKARPDLF